MDDKTCLVIDISRGTMHDGPGLRTTVFLKGCPLRCQWCQNPESISSSQEVWWEKQRCIGCMSCLNACENGAISAGSEGITINRNLCIACGHCADTCPAKAIERVAQLWTKRALVEEVLRDKPYYDQSGGGVTVSGGEALLHSEFVADFFQSLRLAGVSTALDTCGFASRTALEAVLPYTDYVLYDIKLMDAQLHQHFTGQLNEVILDNLSFIANWIRGHAPREVRLWVRTPLIPIATATEQNISEIGRYLTTNVLDVLERWELCAFNAACRSKYDHMGTDWPYAQATPMRSGEVALLRRAVLGSGFPENALMITGMISQAE